MTVYVPFDDRARQQTHFSTCYMCACRCGIKVTVENNRVRFIQGNRNHPVNQGVLCAKGSAGIMKQYSAAKLTKPLKRRPGSARGAGDFVEIEWDEALDLLTTRLAKIRSTDPTKLAFFTGRDQMQALSGIVGAAVRHAQLGGARRLLLGEHGGGRSLQHRLFLLGVRRAGLGLRQVLHALGRRRGPLVEPDQDRSRQAQAARRQVRVDQPRAHRLLGDRRRMGSDPAGDRWPAGAVDGARAAQARLDRLGVPDQVHQRAVAGGADAGHARRRPIRARRRRQSSGVGPGCAEAREWSSSRHRRRVVRDASIWATAGAPRASSRSPPSATWTSATRPSR